MPAVTPDPLIQVAGAPPFMVQLIPTTDLPFWPPRKGTVTYDPFTRLMVDVAILPFCIFPVMPKTKATMTAARSTVIATSRIVLTTSEMESSFFLHFIKNITHRTLLFIYGTIGVDKCCFAMPGLIYISGLITRLLSFFCDPA